MNKKVSKENECVWFKNIECPVRVCFHENKQFNAIVKPKDEIGQAMNSMIGALTQAIPPELQVLPQYCNVCHIRSHILLNRQTAQLPSLSESR